MPHRLFVPCLATLTICLRFAHAQSACCSPHAGTGCALPACQASVCQVDPFCCNTQWDERCASEASVLCADCQPSTSCELPLTSVATTESCGTSTDDPCLGMGFSAAPLPIGVMLHGNAWSSDTARDVDWYQATFDSPTMLQVACWSAGPMGVAIVDDQCPPTVLAESPDGCPATVSACVPAGTVRVVVRPLLFESLACLDAGAAYALQATAMPCTPIRPPNDRCDTALPASVGLNAFDCADATSDPAWLASWCNEGAGLTFTNDVWLAFQAPSTGAYRFSTCGLSAFDVRMALYDGCGGQVLACSDDACPDGGADMEAGLMCGSITLVRIGGWGHGAAGSVRITALDQGGCGCVEDLDGNLSVDSGDIAFALLCFGDMGGPADLDSDGEVTFADVALLLLASGPCP